MEYLHVSQNQVFQAGRPPRTSGFVVVFEGFKEIRVSLFEFSFTEMHFPTAFSDNTHNQWMGYSGLDVKGLLVKRLEFLVVFLSSIHLNLKSVNLKQLGSFLQIIFTFVSLKGINNILFNINNLILIKTSKIYIPGTTGEAASKFWPTCCNLRDQSKVFRALNSF